MTVIRQRPRLSAVVGVAAYFLAALSVSDIRDLAPDRLAGRACPASLLTLPSLEGPGDDRPWGFTVLQGNLWMLPARPLLVPWSFSTDRRARLERLIQTVRSCRPSVVLLQEVFERPMVKLLARHLPEYRVLTSGETDLTGILNASGLVTLTRLPVGRVVFHEFDALPEGTRTIESLARKGVLAVDVAAPGWEGTLLNLHLYAPHTPLEDLVTRSQLQEVMALAGDRRTRGRRVLVAGDFNIPRSQLRTFLSDEWDVSVHGPTFDVRRNPYTMEGSNDTPERRLEKRYGTGVRTIDYLLTPRGDGVEVRSLVLDDLFFSDHQFIQHAVMPVPSETTLTEPDPISP